ncbi:alpha/beta hydrolase [Aerococcaceae bacterium 50-4]
MKRWLVMTVMTLLLAGCGQSQQEEATSLRAPNTSESAASVDNEPSFFTEGLEANSEEVLARFQAEDAELPAVDLRGSGVQESHFLRLNDVDQYVYEVGQGDDLPVAIFLHGGPGFSYTDQADSLAGLADEVNLLFWDQLGAGETYTGNPSVEPTMTDLQASLSDLVAYAKARYGVDQVGIIGHSWGSALGSAYARENPDDVAFYVGIGQVVTPVEDEAVALSQTRDLAASVGRQDLIDQLAGISGDYPDPDDFLTLAYDAATLRSVQAELGFGTVDFVQYLPLLLTGQTAELSDSNQEMLDRLLLSQRLYRELLATDFYEGGLEFKMPFYLISGENDIQVPTSQAETLIDAVQAPTKDITVIPDAGHTPMIDQETIFMQTMTTIIDQTFSVNG